MTAWADPSTAEHSDPAKLREDAEKVEQGQVVKDFIEQRKRVKEVRAAEQALLQGCRHPAE